MSHDAPRLPRALPTTAPGRTGRCRAVLGAGILVGACLWTWGCSSTQRLAGPFEPLPDGVVGLATPDPGATRVTVRRQADGVRIQAPGAPAGYALDSTQPRATAVAGSVVTTAGPGRAEVLWEGSPASVALLGPGALRIGNRNAGEGLARILLVDRARILLGPGDSLDLPGEARLVGDPELPTGPFHLQDAGGGGLELANQAFQPVRLVVGELEVEFLGGAVVTIPATSAAGAPAGVRAQGLDRIQAGSLELGVRGDIRWSEADGRIRLEADGPAEVHGMGLVLRLAAGESATLGPLRPGAE